MATLETTTATEQEAEALRLREEGLSVRAIAERTGLSKSGVDRTIQRAKAAGAVADEPEVTPEARCPFHDDKEPDPVVPAGPPALEYLELAPDQLVDNQFQPRAKVDDEELEGLADNIAISGLLQPPTVRRLDGERFEIAFGHRRVAAVASLIAQKRWIGGVPVDVRELDDEQMAVVALSENTRRKDLSPLEQYRAWAKVVEEIPEMTIERLAQQVGLDRSTVSNNLRVLKLPKFVLEAVDAGEIPAHSARELLVLQNEDHAHPEIMERVLQRIRGGSGLPDFRVAAVRNVILEVVRGWQGPPQAWRPLDLVGGRVEHWPGYQANERSEIGFDVDAYATERGNPRPPDPLERQGGRA